MRAPGSTRGWGCPAHLYKSIGLSSQDHLRALAEVEKLVHLRPRDCRSGGVHHRSLAGPGEHPPGLSSRAGSRGDNPGLPKHRAGFAMLMRAGNLLRAQTARRDNLAVFTAVLSSNAARPSGVLGRTHMPQVEFYTADGHCPHTAQ